MSQTTRHHDCIIIGSGPAGLQLGYFLKQAGRDYLIIDATENPGSFYERFPRHRMLISINKVWTGYDPNMETQLRYDWNSLIVDDLGDFNVGKYTQEYFPGADDYVKYLREFAKRYDINIQSNTRIDKVSKKDQFLLTDADGQQYSCRYLVVATGFTKTWVPDIEGFELTENYWDFSTDLEDYKDKRVMIVGKGNSAFETADDLTPAAQVIHVCSPDSIELAWKSHFFGDLRAVNTNFIDTYVFKGQNSVLDAEIDLIEKDGDELLVHLHFPRAQNQKGVLAYDKVIACTGFRVDDTMFDETCKPNMVFNNRLPAMTSEWESVRTEDMYFGGTVMQMRDFHKTTSNVIHGFRYNMRALHHILEFKYHDMPLPSLEADPTAEALTDMVIERTSLGVPMFLQPGFLGDVLVIPKDEGPARYYEGFPVDYVSQGPLGENDHYYVITMEYGDVVGDPFRQEREPNPEKAVDDVYLHPILRRYRRGELISEFHMPEHLENDWRAEQFPGETKLIRYWEYIGQDDPVNYKRAYTNLLRDWFKEQLTY